MREGVRSDTGREGSRVCFLQALNTAINIASLMKIRMMGFMV
jgi:hypothetical protein